MRTILILVFAAFGAYSLYVTSELGYIGLWQACMANIGTWQLLLDFVILSALAIAYIVRDAREARRNPWAYVAVTVAAGSFGPMLYLLMAPRHVSRGDQGENTPSVAAR